MKKEEVYILKDQHQHLSFQRGQSLIEVLVVLVIAAVMIISLTMVILTSMKNAQYAQNQTKATKYAQDAIDKVRMMRDVNASSLQNTIGPICFRKLWLNDVTNGIVCTSPPNNNECYFKIDNSGTSSLIQKNDLAAAAENLGDGFTRYIIMSNQNGVSNANPGEITMTVRVTWTDSSGIHESKVETILVAPSYDCQT